MAVNTKKEVAKIAMKLDKIQRELNSVAGIEGKGVNRYNTLEKKAIASGQKPKITRGEKVGKAYQKIRKERGLNGVKITKEQNSDILREANARVAAKKPKQKLIK